MVILKCKYNTPKSLIEEEERRLSEKLKEEVVIIPNDFDVVSIGLINKGSVLCK